MSVTAKVENLDGFLQALLAWKEEVRVLAEAAACGIAAEALAAVTEHSAQFSGDFAANWKLAAGAPDLSYETDLFDLGTTIGVYGQPTVLARYMGHPEAVEYARANARGKLAGFKLGDTIWLTNSVVHDEPYAWLIENNQIKFRPGNSGRPVGNWLDGAQVQYQGITAAGLQRLAAAAAEVR